MTKTIKPAKTGRETHNIEFTPGQVVLAVCTLITLALLCFALGIVVAKLDQKLQSSRTASAPQAQTPGPAGPASTRVVPLVRRPDSDAKASSKGTPSSPEKDSAKAVVKPTGALPPVPTSPIETPKPTQAPPPPSEPVAPAGASSPDPVPAVDAAPASPAPAPVVAMPETPAEASPSAPIPLMEPEEALSSEAADAATLTEPPPNALAAGQDHYAVQVMWLSASKKAEADRLAKKLEDELKQPATVASDPDGLRVLVGAFDKKDDAQALCERMKRETKYTDCWVKHVTH